MMTNNNYLSPKMGQMSSSSMFHINGSSQTRKNQYFPNSKNFLEVPQHKNDYKPEQNDDLKPQLYPKALASHSMIDMNTGSAPRRATIGMLDSMARKVTPAFKEDNFEELNKPKDTPSFPSDNPIQSMIAPGLGSARKLSSTQLRSGLNTGKMTSLFDEDGNKKRRESIDLAGLKKEQNREFIPFMRRSKNPEQTKNQIQPEINNGIDASKNKNKFQFLNKRRESGMGQMSTTASVIVPHHHNPNVHSMTNLGQFNTNHVTYKKPQFLSTYQNHHPQHFTNGTNGNSLNVPTFQKAKNNSLHNSHVEEANGSPARNFEFKKKKFSEAPIEPSSARPVMTKSSSNKGQPLTMKQRMAMKNQRQITLDDFQLLEKLGKGAFGDVYMAQEKHIGFVCVIKKMSKKRIRDAKLQQHILREIKIQSYLNHPHLTSLFGYFHDQQYLYLVLEALPDGSLQNVKKKKKLPEKEAAAIIKQVAEGLKQMHQEYIIHRDLKPENLFVNEGTIKLGDFGCSIYNRNLALRNTIVGCLEYSSPQQLSKQGYSDKIDSWSLGIMTYEMLFGKSPFGNDIIKLATNKDMKPQLSSLTFPANISITDETRRFIENLLSENPENRMDMDQVLQHPFLAEQVKKKPMRIDNF